MQSTQPTNRECNQQTGRECLWGFTGCGLTTPPPSLLFSPSFQPRSPLIPSSPVCLRGSQRPRGVSSRGLRRVGSPFGGGRAETPASRSLERNNDGKFGEIKGIATRCLVGKSLARQFGAVAQVCAPIFLVDDARSIFSVDGVGAYFDVLHVGEADGRHNAHTVGCNPHTGRCTRGVTTKKKGSKGKGAHKGLLTINVDVDDCLLTL